MKRSKVLFFGLPLGALALVHDGFEVVGACLSRPGLPGRRRLAAHLAARGAPLLERPSLEDGAVFETLRSLDTDQIVSFFWTRRIPAPVLGLAPFAFNVHPSLLPRHRGPDPYFWALAEEDSHTGVSAHLLTEAYDEGPILERARLAIPPNVNAYGLARLLDRPALAMMRAIARRHAEGEVLVATPQPERGVSEAPEPSESDCELRFGWSLTRVLARIMAAAPWPGAFTAVGGQTVVILEAEAAPYAPAGLTSGQGVRTPRGVVLRAADGALLVLAARAEHETQTRRGEALIPLFASLPFLRA